jgi:acyl-CoA reductase-like NAD-dependent aldehyde dehydrogenase
MVWYGAMACVFAGVYDSFVKSLVAAYKSVKVGDPLEEGVLCGPLHNRAAVAAFEKGVAAAKQQGGRLLTGGSVVQRAGNFVQPTVFEIGAGAACVQHELFAPILYVIKIRDLDQAIELNNAVPQGLASAVFTTNQAAVFKWTGPLGSDCGIVSRRSPSIARPSILGTHVCGHFRCFAGQRQHWYVALGLRDRACIQPCLARVCVLQALAVLRSAAASVARRRRACCCLLLVFHSLSANGGVLRRGGGRESGSDSWKQYMVCAFARAVLACFTHSSACLTATKHLHNQPQQEPACKAARMPALCAPCRCAHCL